jgi:hypothetical protein
MNNQRRGGQLTFSRFWCGCINQRILPTQITSSMKNSIAVIALLCLNGCASVTGSKLQPLSVQSILDGKEVSGVGCTLFNDAGKWFVTTPGSVTVQKSTGDMSVDCIKDDLRGHENLVSKSNGAVWGNIIAGGGIGYIIDRNTGAGFDYPNIVAVVLSKMAAAVGLTTPASATTGPVLEVK